MVVSVGVDAVLVVVQRAAVHAPGAAGGEIDAVLVVAQGAGLHDPAAAGAEIDAILGVLDERVLDAHVRGAPADDDPVPVAHGRTRLPRGEYDRVRLRPQHLQRALDPELVVPQKTQLGARLQRQGDPGRHRDVPPNFVDAALENSVLGNHTADRAGGLRFCCRGAAQRVVRSALFRLASNECRLTVAAKQIVLAVGCGGLVEDVDGLVALQLHPGIEGRHTAGITE